MARARRACLLAPRSFIGRAMLSSTDSQGKRLLSWKTKPSLVIADSSTVVPRHRLLPSTSIVPAVGDSSPPIMRRSVVLPQPDRPIRAMNSPRSMVRSTPETACVVPDRVMKSRPTPWIFSRGTVSVVPDAGALPAGDGVGIGVLIGASSLSFQGKVVASRSPRDHHRMAARFSWPAAGRL
ncbi:hypothetical protein MIC448_2040026 [Microbacterium sp. C448]|nr:hypothetical protein MIC448_2040026 [Microbacterium sp. C448]